MASFSPAMQDYVARLEKEMLDLEDDKKKLKKGKLLATNNRRQHKRYYAYLLKKQDLLIKHINLQSEELFNAVMSSDAIRIGKVEVKIAAVHSQALEIQVQIPDRLKHFAEAIKREQDYKESIETVKHKIMVKLEEIHKYQPCEAFLCNHCRIKKEKRVRHQEKLRYSREVQGAGGDDKIQGMMRRIVRKVSKLSF